MINIPKKTTETKANNKKTNSKDNHKNRGLKWEQIVNDKLLKYRKQGLCFIQKIPTEFTIIRAGARVISAFPKKQTESVDFLGSKQFLPVALETKETQNKTSFPLSNIESHQITFFNNWCGKQGVGYYFVRFATLNRRFLVEAMKINNEINARESKEIQERGDKSLTLEWFIHNGIEINEDMEFIEYIK